MLFTHLTLSGCQVVLGLSDYDVNVAQSAKTAQAGQAGVCRTHADCLNGQTPATATYCSSKGRCEALQSEDCSRLAGPESDPHTLLIATMFATSGVDSAAELARQHAVQLAVEEINERGGIPARDTAAVRKVLLLACDAQSNRERATAHLSSLGVRAILGLSDAEQLFQSLRSQLLAANILTLSTALASEGINSLLDGDLAWLMSLTVEQRAPVMDAVLSALEQHLHEERSQPLKLGLLFRYDSAGRAALSALRSHRVDGLAIGMPEQNPERLRVDRFPDEPADQLALVAAYRSFAPDVIVMLGGVDVLTGFMEPLERSYESDAAAAQRPHYLLTDQAKGPALIALTRELPSLLERVHGVGAAIPAGSQHASEQFLARYAARFRDDELGTAPRVAAAYDGLYALAYAIAAVESGHEAGGRLAQALHALEAPEQAANAAFEVGPDALEMGLRMASSGEGLALLGASGELHWDLYGSLQTGVLEAWCLDAGSGGPRYGGGPWLFDVAANSFNGRAGSCDSWLKSAQADNDVPGSAIKTIEVMMKSSTAGQGSPPSAAGAAGADAGAAGSAGGASEMMQQQVETPPSTSHQSGGALKCGQLSCQRDKEQCCVAMLNPIMPELSCKSRSAQAPPAAGSGATPSCDFSAQCASDADCENDDVCCAGGKQARCVSAAVCSAEAGRRLACKSAQECPAGNQCCLYGDSTSMSFAFSACAPACSLSDASLRVCLDDAGCADDPTSTSCNPSMLLPMVSVCFPKPAL